MLKLSSSDLRTGWRRFRGYFVSCLGLNVYLRSITRYTKPFWMSFSKSAEGASRCVGSIVSQTCASRKGKEMPFHTASVPHLTYPHLGCGAVVNGWFPFVRRSVELAMQCIYALGQVPFQSTAQEDSPLKWRVKFLWTGTWTLKCCNMLSANFIFKYR